MDLHGQLALGAPHVRPQGDGLDAAAAAGTFGAPLAAHPYFLALMYTLDLNPVPKSRFHPLNRRVVAPRSPFYDGGHPRGP